MAKSDLPARGHFPKVKLGKKVPKKAEALLIAAFEGDDGLELPGTALLEGAALRSTYEALVAVGATGKTGEVTRVPAPAKAGVASIIAVGLGDAEEVDDETLRRAAGQAARSITKVDAVATSLGDFGVAPVVEGLILGGYKYSGLRSESAAAATTYTVVAGKSAQEEFDNAKITAESVLIARDLVNTPSNLLYPKTYAAFLSAQGAEAGLEVEVLDEKALEKQGFGGIMAVGRGSARPPRLVRLSWKPKKAKRHVALVGKGITFDTGGISLKPGAKMWDMISDMGGSAAMALSLIHI